MKILPVNTRYYAVSSNIQAQQLHSTQQINPTFTSDEFKRKSYIDEQIDEIKKAQNNINKYFDKHSDEISAIGKIAHSTQEKLKLATPLNMEFVCRNFRIADNTKLQNVEKVLEDYIHYKKNIEELGWLQDSVKDKDSYSTDKINQLVEKAKPSIYKNKKEFDKFVPLHNEYTKTKENIEKDLDSLSPDNPVMPEQLKKLKEINTDALILLLFRLDYNGSKKFLNDSQELVQAYENRKNLPYDFLKRLEHMAETAAQYNHNIENSNEVDTEIKNFLKANKDYEQTVISDDEIKTYYAKLLQKTDDIIELHSANLLDYTKKHPVKANEQIIKSNLKEQDTILDKITTSIIEDRQKYYERLNNEQNSNNI